MTRDLADDGRRELGLQLEEILERPIVVLGPQMPIAPGVDQLRVQTELPAADLDRSFKDGVDPEVAADLS